MSWAGRNRQCHHTSSKNLLSGLRDPRKMVEHVCLLPRAQAGRLQSQSPAGQLLPTLVTHQRGSIMSCSSTSKLNVGRYFSIQSPTWSKSGRQKMCLTKALLSWEQSFKLAILYTHRVHQLASVLHHLL